MPWTEITRPDYDRCGLRYASDSTDEEWGLIEPFLLPTTDLGRPWERKMRDIWNAIQYTGQYIGTTGCQWKNFGWAMLPKDFPTFQRVQYDFYRLRNEGMFDLINDVLVGASRVLAGRDAAPTAGDHRQPIREDDRSGRPRGFDMGKKTKRRKRPVVTDTDGNLPGLLTHPADIQDRDGTPDVIAHALESYPTLDHIFADDGYAGEKLRNAMVEIHGPTIEIVRRPMGGATA